MVFYNEINGKKGKDVINLSYAAVQTAWTNDGMKYAIAFENGSISIRDKDNEREIKNLNLNSSSEERIWCMTFSNSKHYNKDYTLVIGTWEKNIYVIELFNYSIIELKRVNFDPICITLFRDDYFMVGSNNNEIHMYTKEGIFVNSFKESIDSWVMALKVSIY